MRISPTLIALVLVSNSFLFGADNGPAAALEPSALTANKADGTSAAADKMTELKGITPSEADVDSLMDSVGQSFSGAGGIYEKMKKRSAEDYAKSQQQATNDSTKGSNDVASGSWSGSGIYAGFSLTNNTSIGIGTSNAPRERIYFNRYRDPATISNPTLRSLQTGLNNINKVGSSLAQGVNGFADKVRKSNNYFAKALQCSGFDWGASFNFLIDLEALKEYVLGLAETIAAAAPMALLGAFSPQLAELVKHLKMMVNFQLSAEKVSCESMQNSLQDGMSREMWGSGYQDCMNQNKKLGVGEASKICGDKKTGYLVDALGDKKPATSTETTEGKAKNSIPSPQAANKQASGGSTAAPSEDNESSDDANDELIDDQMEDTRDAADARRGTPPVGSAAEEAKKISDIEKTGRTGGNALTNWAAKDQGLANSLWSNTLGTFKMAGSCSVEAGPWKADFVTSSASTASVKAQDVLIVAVNDHWHWLNGGTGGNASDTSNETGASITSIAQSYNQLRKLTWRSRLIFGGNSDVNGSKDYGIQAAILILSECKIDTHGETVYQSEKLKINDKSMDCLAALLYAYNRDIGRGDSGQAVASNLRTQYGFFETVLAMAELEVWSYIYHIWSSENKPKIQKMINDIKSSNKSGMQGTIDNLTARMNEMEKTYYNGLKERVNIISKHIFKINGYVLGSSTGNYSTLGTASKSQNSSAGSSDSLIGIGQ